MTKEKIVKLGLIGGLLLLSSGISVQAQNYLLPVLHWSDTVPVGLLQIDDYLYVFLRNPSLTAADNLKMELENAASKTEYTEAIRSHLKKTASEITSLFAVQVFTKAGVLPPLGATYFWQQEAVLYAYTTTKRFGIRGEVINEQTLEISGKLQRPAQVPPIAAVPLSDGVLVSLSDGVLWLPKGTWGPVSSIKPVVWQDPEDKMVFMHLAVGDFDGDGSSDVAVALADPELKKDGIVRIYRYRGSGELQFWREIQAGVVPVFILAANLDGDGSDDVIVVNGGEKKEIIKVDGKPVVVRVVDVEVQAIFTNYGKFDTVTVRVDPESQLPRSALVVDLDGDSFNDLLVACPDKLLFVSGKDILNAQKTPEKTVRASTVLDEDFENNDELPARLLAIDLNRDEYDDVLAVMPARGEIWVYWGGKLKPEKIVIVQNKGKPIEVMPCDLFSSGYLDLLILDETFRSLNLFVSRKAEITESGIKLLDFVDTGPLPLLGHGALFTTVNTGLVDQPLIAFGHAGIVLEDKATIKLQVNPIKLGEELLAEEAILNTFTYNRAKADPAGGNLIVALGRAQGGIRSKQGDGSLALIQVPTGKPPTLPQIKGTTIEALPTWCTFEFLERKEFPSVVIRGAEGKIIAYSMPWPEGTSPTEITTKLDLPPGKTWQCIHLSDLNKDGKVDYVAVSSRGEVYVRKGTGIGSFAKEPWEHKVSVALVVGSLLVDIDGDEGMDLVLVDMKNDEIIILWGESAISGFNTIPTRIKVGKLPTAIAFARWDEANGVLAVTNYGSGEVSLVVIKSDRSWEGPFTESLGNESRPIFVTASKSMDWLIGKPDDGKPDFIIADYSSATLKLLRFKALPPTETEIEITDLASTSLQAKVINAVGKEVTFDKEIGTGITGVSAVDLNDDGMDDLLISLMFPRAKLDIAQQGQYSPQVKDLIRQQWQEVVIFLSTKPILPTGESSISPARDVAFGSCSSGSFMAVLDSPVQDLARKVTLYQMDQGGWEWSKKATCLVNQFANKVFLSDIDGDEACDIVVLSTAANKIEVFWGPTYERSQDFDTTPGANTVAAGPGWIIAGNYLYLLRPGGIWSRSLLTTGTVRGEVQGVVKVADVGPPYCLVHLVSHEAEALFLYLYSSNVPGGTLQLYKKLDFPEERIGAFAGGDFDGDRQPDVIVFLRNSNLWKCFFGNNRIEVLNIASMSSEIKVAAAVEDVNGDSQADCVIVTEHGRINILLGIGGGFFRVREAGLPLPAGNDYKLTACDLDIDGKSEIIVYSPLFNRVQICTSSGIANKDQNINGLFITVRASSW